MTSRPPAWALALSLAAAAALAQSPDPPAPGGAPAPAPEAQTPAPPPAAPSAPPAAAPTPAAPAAPAAAPSATKAAPAPRADEQLVEEIVAWINDDVVLLSQLREQEQQQVAQLLQESRRSGASPEDLARRVQQVREQLLVDLISQKLLVQEAERLYDMAEIRKDVLRRFKERQKIKTDEELDQQLATWGMTRSELEDRLIEGAAPEIVIDMQVNRNLSVSEAEAREFYEKNKEKLSTPAQVTFREIVLRETDPARRAGRADEARAIVEKARSGTDFLELVRAHSEVPSKALDGRIGPVQPGDLLPEIGRTLLELGQGQVSDPVETGQGWHIFRLEERRDVKTPPFDEIRPEIEGAVREEKYGPAYERFLAGLWNEATIEVRQAYASRIPQKWRTEITVKE